MHELSSFELLTLMSLKSVTNHKNVSYLGTETGEDVISRHQRAVAMLFPESLKLFSLFIKKKKEKNN